jgi:hypothetical protein
MSEFISVADIPEEEELDEGLDEELAGGGLLMGAGMALLRAGVVLGGRAEAEAISALAGATWSFTCATAGYADSEALRAISVKYLGFRNGKTFMGLFISGLSIQSYSIASYSIASYAIAISSTAASSYNLLTL